ncbi:MAG: hypothetical protein Q9226_003755 [Calogaya cf. arnoldii]
MQFKNIITIASLAIMATALPAEDIEARTQKTGQDAQNKCSQNQTAKCCNSLQKSVVGLIPVLLGLNCVTLNLVQVLGGQCKQSQALACCSSGDQTGLVNIGNVCVPIAV